MTDAKLYASIGFFTGLDTVTDPVRLTPQSVTTPEGYKAAYPLVEAMNVEIDNAFALSSRDGLTEKMTGTNMHSFWADRIGALCFFMDGPILYRLEVDYSSTAIVTLSDSHRVCFAENNDRVYYVNNTDIGYIKNGTQYDIPAQTKEFKRQLPAGKFIGVYKTRLFVAKGEILYISDPLSDCYDIRTGYRVFDSDIKMVLPVDNGIYVSDNRTWFLAEQQTLDKDTIQLGRVPVSDSPAVPYTGIIVDGELIGDGGEGNVALWVSTDGICIGDNKGNVKNVTKRKYVMSDASEGSSVMRDADGIAHFISILRG